MHVCCVPGCKVNEESNKECSLFRFPIEMIRCAKWQQLPFLEKSKNLSPVECYKRLRICGKHFTENQFSSMQRNRLKRTAVPNIFPEAPAMISQNHCRNEPDTVEGTVQQGHQICKMEPSSESQLPSGSHYDTVWIRETTVTVADVASQTELKLSDHSPRKTALRNKLKGIKRKIKFLENAPPKKAKITKMEVMDFMQENYPSIATLINTKMELIGRAPKRARYSSKSKQFAHNMNRTESL